MGGRMASGPWSRRLAAGRLAFAWSAFLSLAGVALIVALPPLVQRAESGYCENDDHPGPCANPVEWMAPGLVVLAVGALCLVASVGLLRNRRWGRPAVAVIFSFWAVGVLLALVGEVTSSDGVHPVASITWPVLLTYFTTTVVLAVSGPTGGVIEDPTGVPGHPEVHDRR